MFEDSYLCEVNMHLAISGAEKIWKYGSSDSLKDFINMKILENIGIYHAIIFGTHGGF